MLKARMFEAWGRYVYRWRWATLVVSGVLLAMSIVVAIQGGNLTSGGPIRSNLESARASNLISDELRGGSKQVSTFDLMFKSTTLDWRDPAFKSAVTAALAPIASDPRILKMSDPYSAPTPQQGAALTSADGHEVIVVISLKSSGTEAWKDYDSMRAKVSSPSLTITGTGFVPINEAFNKTLEQDLSRAEYVSLPVTLVLLVLIFSSLVAAGLPLGIGGLTIVGGVAGAFFLNRFTDVSQYALNIVTLIGLGVSIDYSLFIVNRFRDELARGVSREEALAKTIATAGRAITFSGLTVAVGLSAMLFYQGTFLASMGAAGAIVVTAAVFYGLTFLPALLAVIGPGVDRLRLPFIHRPNQGKGWWHWWASGVMRRPWLILVPSVLALLAAATPFFNLRLANGDVDMLPSRLEARQGYDRLLSDFPAQGATTFTIVVYYPSGNPLTRERIADQVALEKKVAAIDGVNGTSSVYDAVPNQPVATYQQLFSAPSSTLPAPLKAAVTSTVGSNIWVMNATSSRAPESDGSRAIVNAIRASSIGNGGQVLVTGQTAVDMDVIKFIEDRTPVAVGFVVVVTYVLLFLLTGSVVLPLKAVFMNVLSIGASFGALVWVFQEGHLSSLLGFTPQSIDPSIPVILFSIVFGMSMDYEVLLVSRIHEEYLRLGDNTAAVAEGLERSGRLITGAAAIMVTVFVSFGLAEVVIIKAIGIGLAIAVALDATIVRALIVPAVMRLLGDFNWWAPAPLRRLYTRARLGDVGAHPYLEKSPSKVA